MSAEPTSLHSEREDRVANIVAKTERGRKLLELRRIIEQSDEPLLDWDQINEEVRRRRGGVSDADVP